VGGSFQQSAVSVQLLNECGEHAFHLHMYLIFSSMEPGPNFRSVLPKFPTDDPDYRILYRNRTRYTHYFYIRNEVLGP
jgi:hypothetical protein